MRIPPLGLVLSALLCFVASLSSAPVQAQTRSALVIANTDPAGSPAQAAENASLMTEALKTVGFNVTVLRDADKAATAAAVEKWNSALGQPRAIGLLYFSGRALQIGGRNYLLPGGADLREAKEVETSAISLQEDILGKAAPASGAIRIVVLEAGRVDLFTQTAAVPPKGLARIESSRDTYIAYAASPGVAPEQTKTGPSHFTKALAAALPVKGASLDDVLKRTRDDVIKATSGRQIPWTSSSLAEPLYLAGR